VTAESDSTQTSTATASTTRAALATAPKVRRHPSPNTHVECAVQAAEAHCYLTFV